MHIVDEVLQHLFGDGKVGDHTVLERPDSLNVARSAAEHLLGIGPDRQDGFRVDLAAVAADRDHRGLVQNNAFLAHIDQGIGRSEVDRQVVGKEPS